MSVLLAFDTATPATVVGARAGEGPVTERRHDPAPGERPQHAAQLLALARDALAEAGAELRDVTRLGCGTGPGTFTGLRIGVATARALAAAGGAELVAVPTLQALARGAGGEPVLAVLDARRGEAFVQAFGPGARPRGPAQALRPEALGALVAGAVRAVGDGAVRFREQLEAAGATVPEDGSGLHRVTAAALLEGTAAGSPVPARGLVPEYVRAPDAVERPRP
jgi:tRNA threonylcarbamoyladenosine biosynthesis protein TsaB